MFPVLSVLAALPWRLIAVGMLTAALFVGGCRYGEGRITARWEAEKAATTQVVAKRAEQAAAVANRQSDINQEISNEFRKASSAFAADRPHLLASVPRCVRDDASGSASAVPEIPAFAAGVDATTANALSAAGQRAVGAAVCNRLAEDAARTTLMVVEFQRWYREQAGTFMQTGE